MSPGPTFDRVYAALREQLLSGRWSPGAHLEPGVIGEDLNASITPVRDALHRLVGERLIDAPRHDGFWVPSLTETQLRGLYDWSGDLLALALRRWPRPSPTQPAEHRAPEDPGALFVEIARQTDNPEIEHAIGAMCDRLAEYRAGEVSVLDGVAEELAQIRTDLDGRDAPGLRRDLSRYHKRRRRAAPMILTARRRLAATVGRA